MFKVFAYFYYPFSQICNSGERGHTHKTQKTAEKFAA